MQGHPYSTATRKLHVQHRGVQRSCVCNGRVHWGASCAAKRYLEELRVQCKSALRSCMCSIELPARAPAPQLPCLAAADRAIGAIATAAATAMRIGKCAH
eukprot:1156149-Pelagomonas_calceolata.AAC.2